MTKYLMDLHPERIEDLMAMVALYRPGPMVLFRNILKENEIPARSSTSFPVWKKFSISLTALSPIRMMFFLWLFSWPATTGKKPTNSAKPLAKDCFRNGGSTCQFVDGCVEYGHIPRDKAEELFKQIETFAAYGFNKAHAASYGIVSYWTAYIKAHYPVEYMTALMSVEAGDTDKVVASIAECEALGIKVLAPDINESRTDFTVVDIPEDQRLPDGRAKDTGKAIRFGLSAIKNVGDSAITAILLAREAGDFKSFTDFLYRVELSKVNKKVVESLIKVGALDRYGKRAQLLAALPIIRDNTIKIQKGKDSNQVSLFCLYHPHR